MIKKIAFLLSAWLAILIGTHLSLRLIPGDPVDLLMTETTTTLNRDALVSELGLDQSPIASTLTSLKQLFIHQDLGKSILSNQKISLILKEKLFSTLTLSLSSFGSAFLLALFTLYFMRISQRIQRLLSLPLRIGTLFSQSLPNTYLGPLFALFFAVFLSLVPTTRHFFLPYFTLTFSLYFYWLMMLESALKLSRSEEQLQFAKSRGVSESVLFFKYECIPSFAYLCSLLGQQIGFLLGGTVVIETLFDWPGMGSLLIESTLKRDYPVVQACVMLTSSFMFIGIILGGLLQWLVDPKQRT